MGPSSLCGRLAGRCLGKMSGEECARLFCRVLGRRLVVFEPEAAIADAGSAMRRRTRLRADLHKNVRSELSAVV
jgi:hypothetical protein